LFSLPPVKRVLADAAEAIFSNKLGTEVEIGTISLGWMNSITVDDVRIKDREGRDMLNVARMSATLNIKDAANGKITIESAQLFGAVFWLSRKTPDAEPNYKFIIDALSSGDDRESEIIGFKINGLIARHVNICYDVESEPFKEGFDANHVKISDAALTMSAKHNKGGNLELMVKRFDCKEEHSGLALKELSTRIVSGASRTDITDLTLKFGDSDIRVDSLTAKYKLLEDGKYGNLSISGGMSNSRLAVKDLCLLDSALANSRTSLIINAKISGTDGVIECEKLKIESEGGDVLADISGFRNNETGKSPTSMVKVNDLYIKGGALMDVLKVSRIDSVASKFAKNLDEVGFSGIFREEAEGFAIEGEIASGCGDVAINLGTDKDSLFYGSITTDDFNVGKLISNNEIGTTGFDISFSEINLRPEGIDSSRCPVTGVILGKIDILELFGYGYKGIEFAARSDARGYDGKMFVNDENLKLNLFGNITKAKDTSNHSSITLEVDEFRPYMLNLTDAYPNDNFGVNVSAALSGNTINNFEGTIVLDSIRVNNMMDTIRPEQFSINIERNRNNSRKISIDSDIISGNIEGTIDFGTLTKGLAKQIGRHLPTLLRNNQYASNDYAVDLQINDSELLRHLLNKDYRIDEPIQLSLKVNDRSNVLDLKANSQQLSYNGTTYENINVVCSNDKDACNANINITRKDKVGKLHLNLSAAAHDNHLNTITTWKTDGKFDRKGNPNNTSGIINAQALFADSLGKTLTHVNLNKSEIIIKDTIWNLHPSCITIYNNKYAFDNVGISHSRQHIMASGMISKNSGDSLLIDINRIPMEYIQGVANFYALGLGGELSGKASVSDLGSTSPNIKAKVQIEDMSLKGGRMGDANLDVTWDNVVNGISISGIINDDKDRWTNIDGYVSPASNDLLINLNTHNTRADFLNGFLGGVFENIRGDINGPLSVIGPIKDVNLQGDVRADIGMTLKPTKTRYTIKGDTIRLQPYKIGFDNIAIFDKDGNRGMVNGKVTHRNFKNFTYEFSVEMNNLLCYDEKEFNSDKFFATLYADGNIKLKGEDGHPLRITANVSPAKNSVFAYDAATPDAIANTNFITFREANSPNGKDSTANADMESVNTKADYKYKGDIYMDVNLNLNKNCEIKLRMDNTENGYMSTFGYGNIKARYHNKSPFKLDGVYHINEGKYRLYLQDIIYRDLLIQPGSQVEFVGDPFDANIHLICHHTINSVPLSDLTATTAYSSNNKVKVVCILDITGTLAQMNFKFDLNLPNVNDETKQLVRSMINSEEEMNTQIIYLLGLGRFYTNEYARMNNENKSSQAVNSLLSSTLSGQINNMLSNVIGTDSKWNFGTGLTTGENGWDDLDVEGILSGRLLDDRLLINGNFGYRDNSITQTSNFIGDFDVRWRISETGNTYIKAYNQTNDRYFTKATLNTQGIGISYEKAFESWKDLFRTKRKRRTINTH